MPGIVRPLAHLAVTALLVSACGGDGASGVVSADGRLEVTGAWVWATPPTSEEAAVYLAVRNSGDTDDRLLGAQSGRCMSMLPHETTIDADGVSRMTEATAAEMRVPAGELVLEPRALHLMRRPRHAAGRRRGLGGAARVRAGGCGHGVGRGATARLRCRTPGARSGRGPPRCTHLRRPAPPGPIWCCRTGVPGVNSSGRWCATPAGSRWAPARRRSCRAASPPRSPSTGWCGPSSTG
ncbi:MAG: copper chaperone PCu(A)C [Ilumatobacteraceae bacterium]